MKVGVNMYVRCVDNRYHENELTVGKIYKVLSKDVWRYETKGDVRFPIWQYEIFGDNKKYSYIIAGTHFRSASKVEVINEILNKFNEDEQFLILDLINKMYEVNQEVDLSKSDIVDIYELTKEQL